MNISNEIVKIELTVELIQDIENKEFLIPSTRETELILGRGIYGSGKTIEEAKSRFWETVMVMRIYNEKRSNQLNRYKSIQLGDWKSNGGRWIIIYGINFFFRYGKGMLGGFYIPFTKFNILILNYWRNEL